MIVGSILALTSVIIGAISQILLKTAAKYKKRYIFKKIFEFYSNCSLRYDVWLFSVQHVCASSFGAEFNAGVSGNEFFLGVDFIPFYFKRKNNEA